jgi:DNA topoisomerase IB
MDGERGKRMPKIEKYDFFAKSEYNCPICGKKFYSYCEDWIYRDKKRRKLCSYTCMLESERLNPTKREIKTKEKKDFILANYKTMTTEEMRLQLHVGHTTMYNYIVKLGVTPKNSKIQWGL